MFSTIFVFLAFYLYVLSEFSLIFFTLFTRHIFISENLPFVFFLSVLSFCFLSLFISFLCFYLGLFTFYSFSLLPSEYFCLVIKDFLQTFFFFSLFLVFIVFSHLFFLSTSFFSFFFIASFVILLFSFSFFFLFSDVLLSLLSFVGLNVFYRNIKPCRLVNTKSCLYIYISKISKNIL